MAEEEESHLNSDNLSGRYSAADNNIARIKAVMEYDLYLVTADLNVEIPKAKQMEKP